MTAQTGMPQAGTTDVRVEVTVEAPIAHAFEVFTTRCGSWWPRAYRLGQTERSDVVIESRVGGRWYERGSEGDECDWGQVLAWEPPHHLALSWRIGVNWAPEPDPTRASRVEVRFVADGPTRTTVTVVHSDFERHGPGWESMRDGVAHDGGWPGILAAYAEMARAEG